MGGGFCPTWIWILSESMSDKSMSGLVRAPSYTPKRCGSPVSAASRECIPMPPSWSDSTDARTRRMTCCSIADGSSCANGFICSAQMQHDLEHLERTNAQMQHDLEHLE